MKIKTKEVSIREAWLDFNLELLQSSFGKIKGYDKIYHSLIWELNWKFPLPSLKKNLYYTDDKIRKLGDRYPFKIINKNHIKFLYGKCLNEARFKNRILNLKIFVSESYRRLGADLNYLEEINQFLNWKVEKATIYFDKIFFLGPSAYLLLLKREFNFDRKDKFQNKLYKGLIEIEKGKSTSFKVINRIYEFYRKEKGISEIK